ncbi:hypothetical protein [Nocardioides sp.]|uniref:sulfotransferase family protein n=1 Tax=Nocardioides sp. TaxID=35761 RepID=UPI0035165E61
MVTLVLVTGSGRSGTSSVAGTLKRLGFAIPQPEVPTDENNPRGYYEPLWVADFHKYWLNGIGVRTIDTRPHAGDVAMADVTPEREAELRDWLAGELAGRADDDVVVVKETRAYWVYPLWERVAAAVGADLVSLTMLRHPAQVVRSRDTAYLSDFSDSMRRQRETANVAAWLNSVLVTEHATRGNPRAFVPYYDLLGDWRAAMTRACGQIGVPVGDLAAPHPVDDFLTTSLNRSAATWNGLAVSEGLRTLAEATWEAAGRLVVDPDDTGARADLDRLREEYAEEFRVAAAIASDESQALVIAERAKFEERLARKNARLAQLREARAAQDAELAQLRAQLEGLSAGGRRAWGRRPG